MARCLVDLAGKLGNNAVAGGRERLCQGIMGAPAALTELVREAQAAVVEQRLREGTDP
jgi:hypothetical protein